MEIINDTKLQQWFDLTELSESTKHVYMVYMKLFCECVGKTPSELIAEAIDETKQGLLLSERNTVTYLAKFKKCLREKDLSPNSQASAITCMKSFYKAFDIQLSSAISKSRRALPQKENMSFLSKEDVQKLITNAKSLRDKAIILVMATSGMARTEIINLRIRDITFDNSGIGVVNIRRQKSQTDYITFISPEATQALKNYHEERNRSNKLKVKGDKDFIFVTYDEGTKIKQGTFTLIFKQLATQLGYTNGEYQIKSKSHALRKYFASTLENAGMPKNKIDFMLGHTPSGNDLAYFKTDVEPLKELYIKFLPYLTFEKNIEVRSLDTEDAKLLEQLRKENERLKEKLESKDGETAELKKRLDKLESALQSIVNAAGKK